MFRGGNEDVVNFNDEGGVKMKNLKVGKMFVWKRKRYLISKFFNEWMWIWDVDIKFENECVVVCGDKVDVISCLCWMEKLLRKKGGKNV